MSDLTASQCSPLWDLADLDTSSLNLKKSSPQPGFKVQIFAVLCLIFNRYYIIFIICA